MNPTKTLPRPVTIDAVTEEFLALQRAWLSDVEYSMYRDVVTIFKGCVNKHAPSKFDREEKAFWHQFRKPGKCYTRRMSEFFGPEKMQGEVKYFFGYFLGRDVHVCEDFLWNAPAILHELFKWLVRERHIGEFDVMKVFPTRFPITVDGPEWVEDHAVPRTPRGNARTLLH